MSCASCQEGIGQVIAHMPGRLLMDSGSSFAPDRIVFVSNGPIEYVIGLSSVDGFAPEMLEQLESYVKLAVDVRRSVLAGGGALHADCEAALLDDGSAQADIWGADWIPSTQEVTYESLINLRPGQGNLALEVQDPGLREQIATVVERLLGGV